MEELKQRIQCLHNVWPLGLMTALPTTPEFITYDAVYLPKNHFIRQETLSTEDYLATSFLLTRSLLKKKKVWNLCGIQIAGKCLR